jgi:hypothetical protein
MKGPAGVTPAGPRCIRREPDGCGLQRESEIRRTDDCSPAFRRTK